MVVADALYDQQAAGFDQRTGVMQAESIAAAITGLHPAKQPGLLLEIGCGTGQIGALLAAGFNTYVGIDLSLAMLQQFRRRDGAEKRLLLQADGNQDWPLADHQADVIFSSRAIHWLDVDHVVTQVYRIARREQSKDALFVLGRVQKAKDGWESQLRRQCHRLLQQHQLQGRDGNAHLGKLNAAFSARNAEVLPSCVVSRWQQKRSLQQSLDDWANKPGLAGIIMAEKIKQQILAQLTHWAGETFGRCLPTQTQRRYVLYPIRLPPS